MPPDWFTSADGMLAITFGTHIVFKGTDIQVTDNGLKLLMHELVHVDQCKRMGEVEFAADYAEGYVHAGNSYENNPLEIEAVNFVQNNPLPPPCIHDPAGDKWVPQCNLIWYKHEGHLDGTARWANNGKRIEVGTVRQNFGTVFGGDSGAIYAIGDGGKMFWYTHEGHLDGAARWANNGKGAEVGAGWGGGFKIVFTGDNGIICAVAEV